MPSRPLSQHTLSPAHAERRVELLLAARDGRILFSKARARNWLRTFFPHSRARLRLPHLLHEWVMTASNGDTHRVVQSIEDEELRVRLASAEAEGLYCLVLAAGPACETQPLFAGRGLTPRQREVLTWLVRGKSNGQIGDILGRKPDTVAKHLQSVFNKLGVDNRSGAIALVWQTQTNSNWL